MISLAASFYLHDS